MPRRVEPLLFVLILLIAGLLRMGWPEWTEFKADEARMLTAALEVVNGEQFAVRGLSSSVGFPNFPMSVWLYAVPLWVWQHVYAATLFTGLMNTLGVGVCYWLVRRYWGVQAALVVMTMFAVSPWAVVFSRKIWAQNLLPLFVMGWVVGAMLAFVEKRPKFILLHFFCLAVVVQIHLAAAALVPATCLLLLVFWRRVVWRLAGAGAVVGAGTAVPFLYYLWQNRGVAEQLQSVGSGWHISLESIRYTAMITLGYDIHSLAGAEQFERFVQQIPWMGWVYVAWGALVLGGIGYWVLGTQVWLPTIQSPLSDTQKEAGFVIWVWLLTVPLFFLVHNTPLFLHYFIATLPAAYVLAGVFVARLRRVGVIVVGITSVFHLYTLLVLFRFLNIQFTPGGFGTPLQHLLETAEIAQTLMAEADVAEILVAGIGESPDTAEFPAIYQALLYGVPHRFVDVSASALFPTNGAVVIAMAGEMTELYGKTAVSRQTIPLRAGESPLQVFVVPANEPPVPEVIFEPPYLLQNWVSFVGYDEPIRHEDGTAVWQLYWHTGGNPDSNQYHFFVHLLNEAGERVSQQDVPVFGGWQGVDTAVTRFELLWPETTHTLRLGMYQFPTLTPVYLLDVAGNPYTDAIELTVGDNQ